MRRYTNEDILDEYGYAKKTSPAKKVSKKITDKARATWYKKQMRLRNLRIQEETEWD